MSVKCDALAECERPQGHQGACGSDFCDECRGSGRYFVDGVWIQCACAETEGDDQDLPCPRCGENICLQDPHTDGVLAEGYEFSCDDCGAQLVVDSVDYSISVCASLKAQKEARRG